MIFDFKINRHCLLNSKEEAPTMPDETKKLDIASDNVSLTFLQIKNLVQQSRTKAQKLGESLSNDVKI